MSGFRMLATVAANHKLLIAASAAGLAVACSYWVWSSEEPGYRTITLSANPPGITDYYSIRREKITFRAESAYFTFAANTGRGWGEQGVGFSFWSESGAPVRPDKDRSNGCGLTDRVTVASHGSVCPGTPYHVRLLAGEWPIEFEMYNGFAGPNYGTLVAAAARNPENYIDCHRVFDERASLFILSLPPDEWERQRVAEGVTRDDPEFCRPRDGSGRGLGRQTSGRGRERQADGSYQNVYRPDSYAVRFTSGPMRTDGVVEYWVQGGAYPTVGPSSHLQIGFLGMRYGSWSGRMVVRSIRRSHWSDDHSKVQQFLRRAVTHRTIE